LSALRPYGNLGDMATTFTTLYAHNPQAHDFLKTAMLTLILSTAVITMAVCVLFASYCVVQFT